ncbi:MAG: glycosyltransferase [Saprospiraceae bacterium]
MGKRIICTVSNDLNFDQRMQRICTTLADAEYSVLLVGRVRSDSLPLSPQKFEQHRLRCIWNKGPLFYAELNVRLFFFLLTAPFDAVCSIDLDTLKAGFLASVLRGKKRVFDAHEYFTEVPELVNKPLVRAVWAVLGATILPFYKYAYTVGPSLARIFSRKYKTPFAVVRNVPFRSTEAPELKTKEKVLLYQGALNEGRGLEALIEAMQYLPDFKLWLAGEGDLSQQLREQVKTMNLEHQVEFKGLVRPDALKVLTQQAWLGINLLENKGLSYYFSLANKFFDYVQAAVPTLCIQFPEYEALNTEHEVAVLVASLEPKQIAESILLLHSNPDAYQRLQENCLIARKKWNWETEKQTLLAVWEQVLPKS